MLVDQLLGFGEEKIGSFSMLDSDGLQKREDFDLLKKDLLQKLLDEALSSNIVKISKLQKRT